MISVGVGRSWGKRVARPLNEGGTVDTATPIEEGALVRLTRDADGHRAGFEFEISEHVEPRPEAERDPGEIDAPIYYGNYNGGVNNVWAPADAVELVKTAAQMDARKLPTRRQLRDGLASEIVGHLGYDGAEIEETQIVGDHEIEAYGRTADGLGFGFTLRVTAAWETDL